MALGVSEAIAEQILAVHEVDRFASSKCGFQCCIIRFPSNHLGVRARKISVNNDLASVRDEHLPDVWKLKFFHGCGRVGGWHFAPFFFEILRPYDI